MLAWDAESGRPLTPIVTWQDKRSQEVLDRLEADGRADEVRERSGMPLDPYFSAGKLAWLLEHDDGVASARDAGTLRLGTVDSFLCDRLGAGFATDPGDRLADAARRRPSGTRALLEIFGVPAEALPAIEDTAGDLGVLRHDSWPVELPLRARCPDQQAALAGAGLRRARAGQGDLRHRRLRARARRRRAARRRAAACFRPSPGGSAAGSSRRSTAASSPRGPCWSG